MILFIVWAFRQKKAAMARFGSIELIRKLIATVSPQRQRWKAGLLVLSVLFLVLALLRPQWGTKLRTVKREGQDILIALDVSKSMLAEDIKPMRLAKAKHEIMSLIDKLEGDRIGLVAFAGEAFVQCPLTLDYGAARMFLDAMEPDLIPVPGTAIGEALKTSIEAFDKTERKHKVMLLITDGEEHVGDPVEIAKEAAQAGIVIYCVGIGSPQGVPIPDFDADGRRIGFKKDDKGGVVMTRLDEITLEKIALETGGKYYRGSASEVELDRIYDDISEMEKKALASQQFAQYEDRHQILIIIALILLITELLLSERRRIKREWRGRFQ
ncbi:VWA domain-containing protein [bacterium]|nr:VWA domain-containing protein [bacterium]